MTSSDRKMDRALAGLRQEVPSCSVWPTVEAYLDNREKRMRRQRQLGYSALAMAASVAAVMVLVNNWESVQQPMADLQKTVDTAIRDARPQAVFSGHSYGSGQPKLETLLVSAKPRSDARGRFIGAGEAEAGKTQQTKPASKSANPVNEF